MGWPFDPYQQPQNKPRRHKPGTRDERIAALAELRRTLPSLRKPSTVFDPAGSRDPGPTASRFGGVPYAEAEEEWPECLDCGLPLDFVCQFNLGDCNHPTIEGVGLATFFYCWKTYSWSTDERRSWSVRLYSEPSPSKAVSMDRPDADADVYLTRPCALNPRRIETLPSHDDLELWHEDVDALAQVLNQKKPWLPYQHLIDKDPAEWFAQGTRVGGWPAWLQGALWAQAEGGPLELLAQIDSEDKAGITWGFSGFLYLFIDPEDHRCIELSLQST